MNKDVSNFIQKHQLFHHGATVLVGVSGGPDSMALLHYLNTLKGDWGFRIIAITIDHGLRGEQSQQDVNYVKNSCKSWGIELIETTLDVQSYKLNERKGTQVAARELRYLFFEEQMKNFNADYLVLGHHGDDQAETMLMRFVRNANPSLLKGIPIKREFGNGFIVRPFLPITKEDIESYCSDHEIYPRRDPSNNEDIYTRNYFRHKILPLLEDQNPNLHKSLQRLSETISHDEEFLAGETTKLVEKEITFSKDVGRATFKLSSFLQYPFALQRRSFHLILNYLYRTVPNGLYYVHENQFLDLIHSKKPNVTVDFPMGLKLRKTYQNVEFYFHEPPAIPFVHSLPVPGVVTLPNGSTITASLSNDPGEYSKNELVCDVNDIKLPLTIRTRKSGDKIKVRGLNGSKKVKDIFIDQKIPLHLRDHWPLLIDQDGKVIWLVGLKKGNIDRINHSKKFLRIHYEKGNI
ncbi:tRNA lysidine(34) synthetase TilS [Aquibacillus halophilus]|uniref:tRNA(Ile)-lysidine synthase n=1 Tax=Aquibacillus halophilus TaxID=930132 RepID=A0A6A8DPI4_9BACI|nr:tRNA lysidine(34) synthetase TilS [Aquibacillus halophilus]MRH44967.1 tRNA lysidine(34) synthetase TilS [Aquibacillus halophilus]